MALGGGWVMRQGPGAGELTYPQWLSQWVVKGTYGYASRDNSPGHNNTPKG